MGQGGGILSARSRCSVSRGAVVTRDGSAAATGEAAACQRRGAACSVQPVHRSGLGAPRPRAPLRLVRATRPAIRQTFIILPSLFTSATLALPRPAAALLAGVATFTTNSVFEPPC